MPESQKKELFSAGITYMVSGEYAFAFSCFTQAGKSDLPTLYNKALCYYYLSLYNDCRSLLLEAERLLPPLTERLPENLPEAVLRWEYEKSPAGCLSARWRRNPHGRSVPARHTTAVSCMS